MISICVECGNTWFASRLRCPECGTGTAGAASRIPNDAVIHSISSVPVEGRTIHYVAVEVEGLLLLAMSPLALRIGSRVHLETAPDGSLRVTAPDAA